MSGSAIFSGFSELWILDYTDFLPPLQSHLFQLVSLVGPAYVCCFVPSFVISWSRTRQSCGGRLTVCETSWTTSTVNRRRLNAASTNWRWNFTTPRTPLPPRQIDCSRRRPASRWSINPRYYWECEFAVASGGSACAQWTIGRKFWDVDKNFPSFFTGQSTPLTKLPLHYLLDSQHL